MPLTWRSRVQFGMLHQMVGAQSDHEMANDELARFDPALPIEEAETPPCSWYTEPAFFDFEKRQVFEKAWIVVGRMDQVRSPGDYFTGDIIGNPYVVVRGDDGQLRAFHNVCRHHAAVVAQECGSCRELVCQYHGWSYRLDGSLRRAPRIGALRNFRPEDHGLVPISIATWGPLVMLDLDGPAGGADNPRDHEQDIAPLKEHLARAGFDHLKWVERRAYTLNCNWKVFVDNSLDGGYHVAYAHEDLAEGLEFGGYQTDIFDRSSIQVCETVGQDKRLGERVLYAWLYPNFFVNRYGRVMDTNLVMPVSVDKCQVIFDFYFDYENLEEWEVKRTMRKAIDQSDVIQREDIDICESAQRGMNSMAFDRGRYSATLERAVHAFHTILRSDLIGQNG
jgi:choline monooxygenase